MKRGRIPFQPWAESLKGMRPLLEGMRPLLVAAALIAGAPAAFACDPVQTLILAGDPANSDARDVVARACARAGRHEEALKHYDRLLAVDADNPDWLLGKAQALIALDRPAEALPILARAHAVSPAYADVQRVEANARAAAEERRMRERGTKAWISAAYEDLSGGRDSWQSASLGVDKKLSAHRHVIGSVQTEKRFDARDEQFSIGWADRIGSDWSYALGLDMAPDGEILPEWNFVAEAGRALPYDMSLSLRARHASYATVDVDSVAAGVEKYLPRYRIGYTLTAAQPTDLDWSLGHTLRFARDYSDENHVTLTLGFGEEAETIAPGVVQVTENRSVGLSGLHWTSRAWGITWEAGWYEQGDLYDRVRLGLGLQHRY